jgi:HemX protein
MRCWSAAGCSSGWASTSADWPPGGCPLGNTFEIVQFVAWSAMLLYFFVGTAFRVSLLGLFTAGYAATLALCLAAHPAMGPGARPEAFR